MTKHENHTGTEAGDDGAASAEAVPKSDPELLADGAEKQHRQDEIERDSAEG